MTAVEVVRRGLQCVCVRACACVCVRVRACMCCVGARGQQQGGDFFRENCDLKTDDLDLTDLSWAQTF